MIRRFECMSVGEQTEGVLFSDGSVVLNHTTLGILAVSPEMAAETDFLDKVHWVDQPELTIEYLQKVADALIVTPDLANELCTRFGLPKEPG